MEQFLNSLYYSFWKVNVSIWKWGIDKSNKFYNSIFPLILPKKMKIKFMRRQKRMYDETLNDLRNYRNGKINGAFFINQFMSCYFNYLSPVILAVMGMSSELEYKIGPLWWLPVIVVTGICYFPLYKYVLRKDRYVSFFRKYERKDEVWQKKWKIIAVIFIALSLPMLALGALTMLTVLEHL